MMEIKKNQKVIKRVGLFLSICWSFLAVAQTNTEIRNLEDFAKVYGVVRYFHPSDETSKINWNQFAVYGTQEMLKSKDPKISLKNLFFPIAPSVSFEGKPYLWNENGLSPVFWIHKGLGIDRLKEKSIYSSTRYNRAPSTKKEYNYVYVNVFPKTISTPLKIVYEGKSDDGGESFAYTNVYNPGVKKANFNTHQNSPIVSEDWEKKELEINNSLPVDRINIGFISTKQGSEFRNIQLFYMNNKKEWVLYDLPSYLDSDWKVNKPTTLIERSATGFKFAESTDNISSKGLNPYSITWDKYEKIGLPDDLQVIIPTVVYTDKEKTLPISDKNAFKELQSHLKSESFNKNVALANVIIVWNILKNFYPYQDVIKVNWDQALEKALKDAYDDKDEFDNYLTLNRFLSNFDDAHMSVFYKGLIEKRKYAPHVALRYINNKLIVKSVSPEIRDIIKGDEIIKIDNVNTQKYIDSLQQYFSGSKQYKDWISSYSLLRGEKNTPIVFTLSNGKIINLVKDTDITANWDFYIRDDTTKAKEINADTYYVNMDKLSGDEMEAEISNIRKYKNLIIDLRGYPRTDQQHKILNYLLPIEDSTKWLCAKDIYLTDFKYYKETCAGHRLRKSISDNSLKTNNVLLVDERSVSNAEMFAQVVKHYKLATIIGRPTAGANGNRNDISLLNGLQFSFTGLKVTNPDGSRFHAIGVIPDIFVGETVDDLKNSKDVYIEKAIDFFNKK